MTETVTPTLRVMATGHRRLHHPDLVADRCWYVLTRLAAEHDALLAISGGAEGADTVWAQSAYTLSIPFDLYLPNRWYTDHYPAAIPADLAAHAHSTRHIVFRPDVADWPQRWQSEHWSRDNFARNTAMIDNADLAVVISPTHPRDLATADKGGTAHAVRALAARGAKVLWIPDTPDNTVRYVQLGRQDTAA